MEASFKKSKFLLFILISVLILISNFALYRLSYVQPLPEHIVIGTLIDLFIMIPLTACFIFYRNRFSIQRIGLLILLSYGAAYLIIPKDLLKNDPFVPFFLGICEGVFLLIELYTFIRLAKTFPPLIKDFKRINRGNSYFLLNIRKVTNNDYSNNRLRAILSTDISLFYYALFSWRTKTSHSKGRLFTYHKKTSSLAMRVMLIHAMAIETIGLHYFLHQWNPIASYILLIFNIYGILFFLAEIQAIRLSPFLVTEDELILQAGLSKGMQIPLREIEEFKTYSGPDIIPGKKKNNIFDARPSDFIMEKPQFEIRLKNKLRIFYMYGLRGSVNLIILSVDNPGTFSSYLRDKLNRLTDSK